MNNKDSHKGGLYRWKRFSDTKVYTRAQKVTTNDDIQDWIKKVETASTKAAEQVFGTGQTKCRPKGKATALRTVEQLREHDTALTEAQELLSQWMDEKVNLDDNNDYMDNVDDAFHQRAVQANVKREWDHLLDSNYEEYGLLNNVKRKEEKEDPYAYLENMDEGDAVESILNHMLNKKVVKEEFTQDLGLNDLSKYKDPRNKMELRHQQVKENREKREKELERRRRDQQAKKNAHHQAKQMILKEDRDKQLRAKKEEMEIRKEMTRIRKEMQDEKRKIEELKQKDQIHEEMINNDAKLKVDQEELHRQQEELEKQKKLEERQRALMIKLGVVEAKKQANNLKTLQQHFSAWYNIVLERHLQMGKARALADWKLLLRAWNAWKSYVRSKKLDLETKRHELSVVKTHRQNQLAESHHKVSLLRKYFVAWQLWIKQEQERAELEKAQEKTRSKMVALLEAAATGKLQTDRSDNEKDNRSKSARAKAQLDIDIDEIFAQQSKRPATSVSDASTDRSTLDQTKEQTTKSNNRNNRKPTQAWQVTKKHVNLTAEEIANLGEKDEYENTEHSDVKVRKRFGTQPWMNTKYITNNFENRHNAQQKILREQQQQLQEQKRLIEELQYAQQQQNLMQQANNQEEILKLLDKQPLSEVAIPRQQSETELSKGRQQQRKAVPTQKLNSPGQISQPEKNQSGMQKHSNVAMETSRSDMNSDLTTCRTESASGSKTNRTVSTADSDASKKSNAKYLSLLKRMEDRATERAKLKAERDEKRKKAEEENLRRLKEEEEKLLKQQEEEKQARVEAYREKKRLEKQKEQEKLIRDEKLRQQMALADAHYIKSLMKFRGYVQMKKLVEMTRQNEIKAVKHHRETMKRKMFLTWLRNVREINAEKEKMADQMRKYLLIKQCFRKWRMFKHHTAIVEGRARRYFQRNLKNRIFFTWLDWAKNEKVARVEKERKARDHYIWLLKSRSFNTWRKHPEELRKEKEREKRRKIMRQTVAALLPDFESMSVTQSNEEI